MRLRNNIFAEALKWLKKNWEGIKYQKDVAAKVGVSEDTITRIMRDQTEVTDDFLCKFNEAFDNVFNYQWLRGEDPYHMLTSDLINAQKETTNPIHYESASMPSSLDRSFMIEKEVENTKTFLDKFIASLEKQIKDKDEQIGDLRRDVEQRDKTIEMQNRRIQELEAIEKLYREQNPLRDWPFTTGVADRHNEESTRV